MSQTRQYMKRVLRWIIRGIPNITVSVNINTVNNSKLLKGKNVLITGSSTGIGFEIAKKCIQSGAKVLINGRNEEKLQRALEKLGDGAEAILFDICNIYSSNEFITQAKEKLNGDIDVLVCNAGVSFHEKDIMDVTIDGFNQQFDTNLKGAYFLAQSFIKNRNPAKEYNILFISSERGLQCDDVPYGLTKAGINSLIKGLSRRFYTSGIRVNGIAPGITVSEMTKISRKDLFEDRLASKRYFLPEEIAEVANFLISDASKCISGEIIVCDAGEYISSYF